MVKTTGVAQVVTFVQESEEYNVLGEEEGKIRKIIDIDVIHQIWRDAF